MKFVSVLLFTLFTTIICYSQNIDEYVNIDGLSLAIPTAQTTTTADIASYVKNNFDTDDKKVRAIYTWVANNIRYDKNSIHPVILEEDYEQKIIPALKTRRGVCENFAAIFNDICHKSGLRSFVIEGYTKQSGLMDKTPHAWCTVFIDNKWRLYDPTWDEGFINKQSSNYAISDYYQASPLYFIQTHMPFDPMFQLLNYPVTYKEFYNGTTQLNNTKPYFNYDDSIGTYEKMDSLDRYISSSTRIENYGTPNGMTSNKIKQLKMEMETRYQDKDEDLYNSAVADYNDALAIYNTFITYRNNQFKPVKTDDETQAMFDGINQKVSTANSKLKIVKSSPATLVLDVSVIEQKLIDLSTHLKEQQAFFRDYKNTVK